MYEYWCFRFLFQLGQHLQSATLVLFPLSNQLTMKSTAQHLGGGKSASSPRRLQETDVGQTVRQYKTGAGDGMETKVAAIRQYWYLASL